LYKCQLKNEIFERRIGYRQLTKREEGREFAKKEESKFDGYKGKLTVLANKTEE
jgi:hypothetical protein